MLLIILLNRNHVFYLFIGSHFLTLNVAILNKLFTFLLVVVGEQLLWQKSAVVACGSAVLPSIDFAPPLNGWRTIRNNEALRRVSGEDKL